MVKCAQAGPGSKPGDLCNLQRKAQRLRCLSLSAAKANEARQARKRGVPWQASHHLAGADTKAVVMTTAVSQWHATLHRSIAYPSLRCSRWPMEGLLKTVNQ
ncbi:uncharacterized [Tachysurus ichikawai]